MQRRTFLAASAAATAFAAMKPALALAAEDNPVSAPWKGPYGGVPAFDKIKVEHFKPAIMAGIESNRAEIKAIAENPAAPNFDNTLRAMQDATLALYRTMGAE